MEIDLTLKILNFLTLKQRSGSTAKRFNSEAIFALGRSRESPQSETPM